MLIEDAAFALQQGEVIAFPTETVYGLGASIEHEHAVQKIFSLKGRPSNNPLIVHLSQISDLDQIAEPISLPTLPDGPLTLVVPKKKSLSQIITGGLETVAFRIPSHPVARALIELVGAPLVAPSANLSGRPSPTRVEHVLHDFGNVVPVVDGGACRYGLESTVLSLVGEPTLLRPGGVTREEIEDALGCQVASPQPMARPLCPGTLYRHYQPNAAVYLVDAPPVAVQSDEQIVDSITPYNLYHMLRQADVEKKRALYIVLSDANKRDAALMNRLEKASCNG